jgi:hypothetical protein
MASVLRRPTVSAALIQQVIITLRGQKAWRNKCLGEAKLQPVNPTSPPCLFRQATAGRGLSCDVVDGEFESLDWEGEVIACPNPNLNGQGQGIVMGGFHAGKVSVSVSFFLLLSLCPLPILDSKSKCVNQPFALIGITGLPSNNGPTSRTLEIILRKASACYSDQIGDGSVF